MNTREFEDRNGWWPDTTREHEELTGRPAKSAIEKACEHIRELAGQRERFRRALWLIRWQTDTLEDAIKIAAKVLDDPENEYPR